MKRSLVLFAFLIAGCGTDSTNDPMGECSPGERMACDCSPTSTGTMTCEANETFGACGQCSLPDPDPQKVNFQSQIAPIFAQSCGTAGTGCHGRDAYGANVNMECRGWLTLEDAALGATFYSGPQNGQDTGCDDKPLYDRLMSLKVWQCSQTTAYYVTAGDVSKSYIMNKLDGVNMCKENATSPSDQMPPPQDPGNPNPYEISAGDRALIQQWIVEGALDN